MTSSDITARVRSFLVENWGADFAKLPETDPLFSSDRLSSLDFIRLLLFIEESFGVKLDVEKIESQTLDTITDIASFIKARQA